MPSKGNKTAEAKRLPDLLTVREAAAALRVGEAKLRRLIHEGILLACRIGVEFRIPQDAIQGYVERTVAVAPLHQKAIRGKSRRPNSEG